MTNTFYPRTNSLSPESEQLKEIQEMALDQVKIWQCDRRKDPLIFWKPIPYDPRFPNIDITKRCVSSFTDYYRCRKLRGPDYEPCEYFKLVFEGICTDDMIDRMEGDRKNGAFLAGV